MAKCSRDSHSFLTCVLAELGVFFLLSQTPVQSDPPTSPKHPGHILQITLKMGVLTLISRLMSLTAFDNHEHAGDHLSPKFPPAVGEVNANAPLAAEMYLADNEKNHAETPVVIERVCVDCVARF